MQLDVGTIVEGKITGIAKFGAFVEIKKGVTGLVHISEISNDFVADINKILKCGDIVKVKILNNENNRLSLSIKQTQQNSADIKENEKNRNSTISEHLTKHQTKEQPEDVEKEDANHLFEQMLSKYKKTSEERWSDIKKNLDNKKSPYSRKRKT